MNNFNKFLNHLNSFSNKQPIREQSSNYSYSDSSMKRLGKDLSNPTPIATGALAGGVAGGLLGGPVGALAGAGVGALNGVAYNALPTMMNNFSPDDSELDTNFDRVQKRTEQEEQKRREDVSKANPDLAARMQEDPRNRPGIGKGIARAMNDMSRMQTKVNAASGNLNNLQHPLKENTYRSIFLNHLNSFSKKPIINESKRDPALKGLDTTWGWGKRDWSDGTPELQTIKPGAGDDAASSLQTGEVSRHNAGHYFTSANPAIDVNDELIPYNERQAHAAAMHDADSDNMHIAVVQHIKSGRFSITDTTHARGLVRDGSNRHVATYTPGPNRNNIQEQQEKSSLKKKYKLNEISGRFWSPGPEGRGPDRVSKGSPPAMQLLSDKPATELEPRDIQQVHRTNLLAHQHQMFSEYHPTFFASMPPNSESTYTANQKRAIRVAQSKNANEETLLLAASHNDPIVRAATHDNRNATDNVKGMALLHQSLQRSMMASLQYSRISPTALFAPENRKIVSAIGTKLKSFRTAMSNHMSRGGNLLELHERQQRGEDTDANGNQID